MPVLEVDGLSIAFGPQRVVEGVDFSVEEGERVALLGASGSGKSLTAAAILGTLPYGASASGQIRIGEADCLGVSPARRQPSQRAAAVFQDSAVALNPLVRVSHQLFEPLRRRSHVYGLSGDAPLADQAANLLSSVGLADPRRVLRRVPAELSGGERQRVCIALALACETQLIVADEPTTALDVVTQAQVIDLLRARTSEAGASLLFITHDLAVAAAVCDRAIVLVDGKIVENAPIDRIIREANHPYTQQLVRAARALALPSKIAGAVA